MTRNPDFIVIGAQKAASTFLQFCLSDHPDIWMPRGETPYFEDPDYFLSSRSDLTRLFQNRSEKLVGIKRPQYIGRAEVAARISGDLPEARLIAVLRNPVDRTISAYFHYMRGGFLPVLDPEIGIIKLLNQDESFLKEFPRAWEVLEFGLYHKHLVGFSDFLKRDRLKILLHEDIRSDPIGMSKELYQFLEVNDEYIPKRINSRPQAVNYNLRRLTFLSLLSSIMTNYNCDKTRSYGAKNPLAKAAQISYTLFDSVVLSRVWPSYRPELSSELRERLENYFKDDIVNLSVLLKRDLSHWLSH